MFIYFNSKDNFNIHVVENNGRNNDLLIFLLLFSDVFFKKNLRSYVFDQLFNANSPVAREVTHAIKLYLLLGSFEKFNHNNPPRGRQSHALL